MEDYRELLLGCGSRTSKDIAITGHSQFTNLTRLDNNPDHHPDVLWDLRNHPLPFEDNSFNEIHAYDVLEHLANQGDYEFFFAEWSEYWRILRPRGLFFLSVPDQRSIWAWSDPSHKRVIPKDTFIYLDQEMYHIQVGKTQMSDFRYLYKADFQIVSAESDGDVTRAVLLAVKPARTF